MADRLARAVFGLLFDTSCEAVFVVDRATATIISANQRAADMLACDLDAMLGMRLADTTLEPERDLLAPGHYEDVALRRSDDYPLYVELDVVHVDTVEHGALAAYMARDTSERRLLQRELLVKHTALYTAHAELAARNQEIALLAWRAAMGEVVAGIAHHLNNPVGALASTLRRMTLSIAALPAEHRTELDRQVARVAEIARRIETNVAAIVTATRAAAPGSALSHPPPELAAMLSAFAERLDEIPMKDRP